MKWISFFLLVLVFSSCKLFEEENTVVSSTELADLQNELLRLSESIPCTNASEWKTTPMGSKACGGPVRYIAYHQSIEQDFLARITRFTALQDAFNKENNLTSDCMAVSPPVGVRCEANKPVLF